MRESANLDGTIKKIKRYPMSKIFMSYSHKDESHRNELETHLSMLKREGLISTWHDRKILAGDEFKSDIDENLEDSNIILLLVSPYFIESDYCFDIEMKRALVRHEKGEARVIPIILEHCDWHSAPFGKLEALPQNGQPITEYPNQHKAFTEIARGIREVIEANQSNSPKQQPTQTVVGNIENSTVETKDPQRSSNLRVKKSFSDKERDDFLNNSFEYIHKFFKNSLEELRDRNKSIDFNIERIDSQTFTVKIYKEEKTVNECRIWKDSDFGNTQTIKYANSTSSRNSFNMMFTINDDGYTQYLESSGLNILPLYNSPDENNLNEKGTSEQMWAMLIKPLQQ
jgi:hypothetical protein